VDPALTDSNPYDSPNRRLGLPRVEGVRRAIEPLAFWASVRLPLAYVRLLYGGFGDGRFELFLALVGLDVAGLVVGHQYGAG